MTKLKYGDFYGSDQSLAKRLLAIVTVFLAQGKGSVAYGLDGLVDAVFDRTTPNLWGFVADVLGVTEPTLGLVNASFESGLEGNGRLGSAPAAYCAGRYARTGNPSELEAFIAKSKLANAFKGIAEVALFQSILDRNPGTDAVLYTASFFGGGASGNDWRCEYVRKDGKGIERLFGKTRELSSNVASRGFKPLGCHATDGLKKGVPEAI